MKLKILLFSIFLLFIVIPVSALGYLFLQSTRIKPEVKRPEEIKRDVESFAQKTKEFENAFKEGKPAALEITEEEIEALLLKNLPPDSPIKDVSAEITKGKITLRATIQKYLNFNLSAEAGIETQGNFLIVDPGKISLAGVPLPVDWFLNRASQTPPTPGIKIEGGKIYLDLSVISPAGEAGRSTGFNLKEIRLEEGKIILSAQPSQP